MKSNSPLCTFGVERLRKKCVFTRGGDKYVEWIFTFNLCCYNISNIKNILINCKYWVIIIYREMLTCALKVHVKNTNIVILSCNLWIVLFKH
jgi:hypothetical protein